MTVTINQIGKTYKVSDDNKVKTTHIPGAIVSVCGEYYKNKYTGEWLSELEAEQAVIDKYEEDEDINVSKNLFFIFLKYIFS